VTEFSQDAADAAVIEARIREQVDLVDRETAKLSEFAVDTPITARRKLDEPERETTVALNVMCELLAKRASEAGASEDPRWHGLADAATMVWNETGRRGLPQLAKKLFVEDHPNDG
jgi:hypothetical protein